MDQNAFNKATEVGSAGMFDGIGGGYDDAQAVGKKKNLHLKHIVP